MTNSSKSAITEQFQEIDRYAPPIRLNVEGKDSLKSICGACSSLVIIILLIALFISQLSSMVHRVNPQLILLDEFQNDPGHLGLSENSNFIFAISITANGANVNMTDSSIVSFTSTYNQNYRQPDGTTKKYKSKIQWAPCQPYNFPESIFGAGVFELYSLAYMYCPQYIDFTTSDGKCPPLIKDEYPSCQTPPNFIIKGTYLSKDFEFIQFKFKECRSSDADYLAGLQCASNPSIVDTFGKSEIKVNAYFTNTLIKPLDHKTPNQTYLDSIYWTLNPSVSKLADVFMDQQTVQDYDDYFNSGEYKNSSFYSVKLDAMREIQVFQSSSLLELNFRRSNINHVTKRVYPKILDVLSTVGGVAHALFMIVGILLVRYMNYRYKMKLSNELYDFAPLEEHSNKYGVQAKTPKSPKNKNNVKKNQIAIAVAATAESARPFGNATEETSRQEKFQREINLVTGLFPSQNLENPGSRKTNKVKEYFDNLERKKRRLDFSEWQYGKSVINWLLCRKDSEEQLAKQARNQITKDLDIIKVVEKLKEIDKLKAVLLSPDQKEVFSFIEKPVISLKSETPIEKSNQIETTSFKRFYTRRKAKFVSKDEYEYMKKYSKLYSSYRCLATELEGPESIHNERLIRMMGEDLLKIFRKVDQAMGDKIDPAQFEVTMKKLMNSNSLVDEEEATLFELPSPTTPYRDLQE